MTPVKRKLIEVSLPLEAINRESAREKAIRFGHPSTLHLWWARRPLAACRAVLFSQLVDDPSSHPDQFPTEQDQERERQRLFDIIERLVVWENINDEALLNEAHEEILRSTKGNPPAILDPFAGGGSIPLEAQRLGLEAHASDLNPVAVLINKALIEVPAPWVNRAPVYPGSAGERTSWTALSGLAADVHNYAALLKEKAHVVLESHFPPVKLPDGTSGTPIAWLWARTCPCSNPACGLEIPLVRTFWLGKKKGKEAFIQMEVVRTDDGSPTVRFEIGHDLALAPTRNSDGTMRRTGAECPACGASASMDYLRKQARAGKFGSTLMAIAVEGSGRRHYLHADPSQVQASIVERPTSGPYVELADNVWDIKVKNYGMTSVSDLFSDRQLLAMTTFSDMVDVVAQQVREDAVIAGWSKDDASAYSDSIALYLAFAVSRQADYCSSLCTWGPDAKNEGITHVFGRQAIPMVWDFAEVNPFSNSSGNFAFMARGITRVLEKLDPEPPGHARQANASTRGYEGFAISTDPPYYDNVGYANLSDYFYAWLRRCVGGRFPEALATVQTPKSDELVADPYRHGDRRSAGQFFEAGFRDVFARMRAASHPGVPVTVFYAFKQADVEGDGLASTGWQTLLEGLLSSGWEVTATWPMRTELGNRLRAASNNSLASSIVLALRPRPGSAETTSRRAFVQALGAELPHALKALQQGSIAPVDMAQAAIGPGMAVFSRYARVLEADGSDMSVRTALALINQALDEVLAKQEGDFDPETRFAVKWFSQYGWNEAPSGEADVLTRAVNTTVSMLERGGIFRAAAGKARLIEPSEMSAGWNPAEDKAISVWEVAVRLGHALLTEGTDQAAAWMRESAARVDLDAVKELSYLMYSVCERKGWAESAMLFNALGTSWGDVSSAARSMPAAVSEQESLTFGDDDDE